jgi:hypothetical protein
VKAVVRLSDPAVMDLVLRKRISFNVYKRHSITDKIRRKMGHTSSLASLGVTYEIVSNIPKVIHFFILVSSVGLFSDPRLFSIYFCKQYLKSKEHISKKFLEFSTFFIFAVIYIHKKIQSF